MPTRETLLQEHTHKDDPISLERRIFQTLDEDQKLTLSRTAKALSLLIKTLHDKKTLNEKEIDDILLEATVLGPE